MRKLQLYVLYFFITFLSFPLNGIAHIKQHFIELLNHNFNKSEINKDSIFAEQYFAKAKKSRIQAQYDSAIYYFQQASRRYKKLAIENERVEEDIQIKVSEDSLAEKYWYKYFKCVEYIGWNFGLIAEYEKGLEVLYEGFNLVQLKFGKDHNLVARMYNNIGAIYFYKGEYGRSLEFYEKSLQIDIRVYGSTHAILFNAYNNIGVIYTRKGDYDEAMMYYKQSLNILLNSNEPNQPSIAQGYNNIGIVCDFIR